MKRIMTIIAVVAMSVAIARAEDEFVSQMECIDGIWYETFMPSKEFFPLNTAGRRYKCNAVLSVAEDAVFARVCHNKDEKLVRHTGNITIPSHVAIGGKEYEVVAIGPYGLAPLGEGAKVSLPSTIKIICESGLYAYRVTIGDYFDGNYYYENAYVKLPESLVAVEQFSLNGVLLDDDLYLPNISLIDYWAMVGAKTKKMTLGSRLTGLRDYSLPTVSEKLVFEEGDSGDLFWDGWNEPFIATEAICLSEFKELVLPKREKLTLADYAISHCENLERLVFPDTPEICYSGCLSFNGAIGFMPYYGYFIEDCPNLSEVVCLGAKPPHINITVDFSEDRGYEGTSGEFEFVDNIDDCVLKVPAGSEELYRADPVWGKFKTIYGFENGDYTSIVMPEVAAPEAESTPVYHNLQGMSVEHPVRGQLYIRTVGSRTDKVVF